MSNRNLSLLIFRGVLLALILGYQLLGLLFPFPRMPFVPILSVAFVLSAINIVYGFFYLRWQSLGQRSPKNFVFLQLTIDILAISALILYTGGIQSNLKFAYLIFILISALFLDKIAIYAITMLSLALYFLALHLAQFLFNDTMHTSVWYWSEKIGRATVAQFVLCFLTALLSAFMQSTYRVGQTALREKELRIRSLRRIRRQIVETLPSGLIICNPNGMIDFINHVGHRLLKIQQEADVTQFNAWDMLEIHPNSKEPMALQNLVRTERRLNIGGVRRFMGISYTPMEHESGQQNYMIVFQDLTKIKMLEAHHSLDERMTAIGKVAAGVAHEIRNPLAAISGSVQVLKELTPDDEAAQDLAEIVVNETQRLDQIISQFMAYARPGPPAAFHPVSLEGLITSFYKLASNDQRLKTMTLEKALPKGEETLILADEGQLTQVLWNLATNSYYASEQGARLIFGCYSKISDAVLFIQDHGKGMTEDQVRDLFTPFQSFSKSGTGLGMSIVYDIIKTHHGKIDVHSKPAEGTRIEISFATYKE